ncbi:hypothetical protein Tco_0614003 [Tanacetum coccineum]
MESNNMKSSCLDKDEQEIQRPCEIKKEMQKKFDNIFHNFQICIHSLRPDWIHQRGEYAFQFLFGTEFQSFKKIFDNNIDQLKEQLDKEELHDNSGNDTHAEGPDIRLSNGTKPLHEVQSTVAYNEDANDRHHANPNRLTKRLW